MQSVNRKILLTRHYVNKVFMPEKRSYKHHLQFQNANISPCSYICSFSDILHFQNCLPSYIYFLPVLSYIAWLAFRYCLYKAFFILITLMSFRSFYIFLFQESYFLSFYSIFYFLSNSESFFFQVWTVLYFSVFPIGTFLSDAQFRMRWPQF